MISDLDLAKLSLAIYDPHSTWDRDFVHLDLRIGCRNTPDGLLVVPRGTAIDLDLATAIANLRRDADCYPIDTAEVGPVHRGFWTAAMLYAEQIDQTAGDKPIIATGHSLGGAIAMLLAARRRAHNLAVARLVTFGGPKVAFSLFNNPTKIENIMNGTEGADYARFFDPIVTEPGIGYRHARGPTTIEMLSHADHLPLYYHQMVGYLDLMAEQALATA